MDLDNTMFFRAENKDENSIQEILKEVYHALEDKGYDPVNQIVGYLLSDMGEAYLDLFNVRSKEGKAGKGCRTDCKAFSCRCRCVS